MKNKIALVIGNGFDLDLGLNTSYKNFLTNSEEFKRISNELSEQESLSPGRRGVNIFNYLMGNRNIDKWIDVEKELKNFAIEFNLFNKTELIDLTRLLQEYLDEEDKRISSIPINQIIKTNAFKVLREVVSTNSYEILNFNYTSSVHFIMKTILGVKNEEIQSRVHHVHGSLLNKNIVVGVDLDFTIAKKHPFLVKFNNEKFKHINIIKKLKNSSNLVFFGHSLGETDHSHFDTYFKDISDTEKFNPRTDKTGIFIFYYGSDDWDNKSREISVLTENRFMQLMNNNKFEKFDSSNFIFKFDKDIFLEDQNVYRFQ